MLWLLKSYKAYAKAWIKTILIMANPLKLCKYPRNEGWFFSFIFRLINPYKVIMIVCAQQLAKHNCVYIDYKFNGKYNSYKV
jgi:hypothetical protein